MYELLIVDDEIHIAKGIQASAVWEELGISAVHIANSVRQARGILEQRSIPIVICDIEMPEANGFELLEWVKREYDPAAEVIFLTCHAEFTYAQKAVRMGSLDYILKPILPDVLRTVVHKAIHTIAEKKKYKPILIERFWQDVLSDRISSQAAAIRQRIDSLQIPIEPEGRFLPIAVCVRRWMKGLDAREEKIMEYALGKIADELFFQDGTPGYVVSAGRGIVLVVLPITEQAADLDRLRGVCQSYLKACSEYLSCRLSCYIGEGVYIHEMKRMYTELLQLDRRNGSDRNRVLCYGERMTMNHASFSIDERSLSLWSELFKRGDKAKLLQDVFTFIEEWKEEAWVDYKHLQDFYHGFLRAVHYAFHRNDFVVLSELISPERGLLATRSVTDLAEWVTELTEAAIGHRQVVSSSWSFAEKVKAYIGENIDRDFSRQELADHLGMNPDYVVKLFKKETGIAVSDYILSERVTRAKHLLVKTDIPVAQISLHVGFSNFSYFSKVFKNATKLSPIEYRKKNRNA